MNGVVAASPTAEAGGGAEPNATNSSAGLVFLAAAAALAGGAGLVWVGLARLPSHGASQDIVRGAPLYIAECAGCHGTKLEGQTVPIQHGASISMVPPLGVTGHAWRHSDGDLITIVAYGTGSVAIPTGKISMPAFADRLSRDEIRIILAYVKSRWLPGFRLYQASLTDSDKGMLAASLLDPSWTFPGQCLPSVTTAYSGGSQPSTPMQTDR